MTTRLHRLLSLPLVAVLGLILGAATDADAFPQFQKQFLATYADGTDADYTKLAKGAKCFVCHQGKKKKNRNAYGEALHQYLGKKDKKDVEKILKALETVAAESSDPGTPDASTFGDLIAAGELPGGSVEDAKKEPGADE